MPKPNQAVVTIRKDTRDKARKQADAKGVSLARHITDLVNEAEVPVDG